MNEKDLWEYFWQKKISHAKRFSRDFIWIEKEDFQPVRKYFIKEFNLFHAGESFRSRDLLSHVHVVDQGNCMFVHRDMGNIARFFPLGVLHFVCNVAPDLIRARLQGIPRKEMFVRPQ